MKRLLLFLIPMLLIAHGNSIYFDGTESTTINDHIGASNTISGFAWIQGTDTGNDGGILYKNGEYVIRQAIDYFRIYFYTETPTPTYHNSSSFTSEDGEWHQIGFTYNATTESLKIYFDGAFDKAYTSITATFGSTNTLYLGRFSSTYWKGNSANYNVFDRELTPTEIAWNYRHPERLYDTTSCRGFWKHNEGTGSIIGDSSLVGNDGTTTGSWSINTPVSLGSASHGSCLEFDVDDDSVKIPNSADFNWGTGDFSIEFWMKTTDAREVQVCNKGFQWWTLLNPADHKLYFKTNFEFEGWKTAASDNALNDNKWYHVICSCDNGVADGLVMYVDGVLQSTKSTATGNSYVATAITLGTRAAASEFTGTIKQIRVYSRLLTGAERTWNYRHPTVPYDTSGCVLWLPMNEFTGTVVGDSSSKSNDGTLYTTTWSIDSP